MICISLVTYNLNISHLLSDSRLDGLYWINILSDQYSDIRAAFSEALSSFLVCSCSWAFRSWWSRTRKDRTRIGGHRTLSSILIHLRCSIYSIFIFNLYCFNFWKSFSRYFDIYYSLIYLNIEKALKTSIGNFSPSYVIVLWQ